MDSRRSADRAAAAQPAGYRWATRAEVAALMGDSVHDHNDVYYYKGQGGWSTLDEGHTDILGCRRLLAKISIPCVTQSERGEA